MPAPSRLSQSRCYRKPDVPLAIDAETYRTFTTLFDHRGNEILPVGIAPLYDTGYPFLTFVIMKPAVTNTHVDMSSYGQPVFANAVDAMQAARGTFDAVVNEVDVGKIRVSLSDVLSDREAVGKSQSQSRLVSRTVPSFERL